SWPRGLRKTQTVAHRSFSSSRCPGCSLSIGAPGGSDLAVGDVARRIFFEEENLVALAGGGVLGHLELDPGGKPPAAQTGHLEAGLLGAVAREDDVAA